MSSEHGNGSRHGGFGTEYQRRAPPPQLTPQQQDALSALYELHYERLVRFAQRALPADVVDRPEDLAQTVFAEAATALSHGLTSADEGWLYGRLRARLIDRWRRARRQRMVRLESAEAAVELVPDPARTPDEEVASRDFVERLLDLVSDRKDREALRYLLDGYSEREIAALMSLDYKRRQVRERIRRARRQLRRWQLDEWPSEK